MRMPSLDTVSVANNTRPLSERLNRECTSVTLDREALCAALEREAGDPDFGAMLVRTRPHLFSSAPVFLSEPQLVAMLRTVRAIESLARLPAYRDAVLSRSAGIARRDFGPRGAFMGYDFHLAHDGPRLIEINTNAGGAFLNALLARAQHACCEEMLSGLRRSEARDFDAAVARMFESEWRLQRRRGNAAAHRHRRRPPGGAIPLPRIPACAAPPRQARHGSADRRRGGAALRTGRAALATAGRSISSTTAWSILRSSTPNTRYCARPISPTPWSSRRTRMCTRSSPTSATSPSCPIRRGCVHGESQRKRSRICRPSRVRCWSRPRTPRRFGAKGRSSSSSPPWATAARQSTAATA